MSAPSGRNSLKCLEVLVALVTALVVSVAGIGSLATTARFVYDSDSVTAAVHAISPNHPTADLHVARQAADAHPPHRGRVRRTLEPRERSSAPPRCWFAPNTLRAIETPHGLASQGTSRAAMAARAEVESGTTLWRIGTTGRSAAGEAQFWSLEHPLTPGYASRYGVPPRNIIDADFIESAVLRPGSPFITRGAPGFGPNIGGGIEAVVPEGGVWLRGFSYFGPKGAL